MIYYEYRLLYEIQQLKAALPANHEEPNYFTFIWHSHTQVLTKQTVVTSTILENGTFGRHCFRLASPAKIQVQVRAVLKASFTLPLL